MCYEVIPTKKFNDDIKFYIKKRKYTKIMDDISDTLIKLEEGELVGDEIDNLNLPAEKSSYKVRVANSNTKVGKVNGYRIIYYVIKDDKEIYLLSIYYKKDNERVLNKDEVRRLIVEYCP